MSRELRMTLRMNAIPPTADAREQAEAWYARLMAPDCSHLERDAFERWRSQPGHAEAYAATERLLAGVNTLANRDPRVEALMQRARRRPVTPARRTRRWGAWAVAASMVFAVALGLHFGPALLTEPDPVQYAAAGEGRTLTLEDGSSVQLDVASRFTASLGRKQRSLELQEGRALFEVAHDAARPFVVRVGGGSVTALGTRFQVQREGERITVMLAEGTVAVARQVGQAGGPQQIHLQPGQQLRWSGDNMDWTLRHADTEAALGWTRGRLIFRGTPLADVVAEVNRYSARKLVLSDPSLARLPVHGNFVAGDAGTVVAALGAVLPVRVEEDAQEIRIERR